MKKNKFQIIYIAFFSSLMLGSCSDDFLDINPTDSVKEEDVYSTVENLYAAINGMHRNMYVRQNDSQGQNGYTAQIINADVMGEDLIFPTTGNGWFRDILRWLHTDNESSTYTAYPWNFWYSMIKNANLIIVNGGDAEGDQELLEKVMGEAYAYRAFGHFQLVQTYGKRYVMGGDNSNQGVLIQTDPEDRDPKPRATVEEVYAQIWSDLEEAEKRLENADQDNNSHFSVSNVRGLMARVALVQQDYLKAEQYAAMAREGYSLMSVEDYKMGFNDYTNPEWMWGVHIREDQTDYFGNFHAYMSRNYNSTQIRQAPKVMNVNLYDAFPDSDVRKQLVDPTGEHEELNLPDNFSKFPYTSQKFLSESTASSLGDVPFMRVAEMYLIEAEAKYQNGDEPGSKAILEELVEARDPDFSGFSITGEAYYEEILIQRRMELWGEGFRFFDLKRLGRKVDRNGTNAVGSVINNLWEVEANDSRWQWAIPIQEINANPEIDQNPL
ncbi:RagB/SusD family nutrient uptake outer membrane protein [Sinomicrobium sp.]